MRFDACLILRLCILEMFGDINLTIGMLSKEDNISKVWKDRFPVHLESSNWDILYTLPFAPASFFSSSFSYVILYFRKCICNSSHYGAEIMVFSISRIRSYEEIFLFITIWRQRWREGNAGSTTMGFRFSSFVMSGLLWKCADSPCSPIMLSHSLKFLWKWKVSQASRAKEQLRPFPEHFSMKWSTWFSPHTMCYVMLVPHNSTMLYFCFHLTTEKNETLDTLCDSPT